MPDIITFAVTSPIAGGTTAAPATVAKSVTLASADTQNIITWAAETLPELMQANADGILVAPSVPPTNEQVIQAIVNYAYTHILARELNHRRRKISDAAMASTAVIQTAPVSLTPRTN